MRNALFILLIIITSCKKNPDSILTFVDPIIGTTIIGNSIHTACVPFGMAQLGPEALFRSSFDSNTEKKDSIILGFTHTHISGIDVPAWGDILFMPTKGNAALHSSDGRNKRKGYSSLFSKKTEQQKPGYYSVLLDDDSIRVELTATAHCGFHSYHFPTTDSANVIIDLSTKETNRNAYFKIISDNEIEGYRHTIGAANHHYVFFYAKLSKSIQQFVIVANDSVIHDSAFTDEKIKSYLRFRTDGKEPLKIKIGLSQVSCEGARKNLENEITHWDFSKTKKEAENKWLDKLNRIEIETDSLSLKKIFYTALFRCFLNPQLASDVDGQYRGMDQQIHIAKGFHYYNVFSLWETYRTLHPLFTLIDSKTNTDFIKSILVKYQQNENELIKKELASCHWKGSIGNPAIPIIVDALVKGQDDFDTHLAWKAIDFALMKNSEVNKCFTNTGFVPCDRLDYSLSLNMQNYYECWAIAQFAKRINNTNSHIYYLERSKNYKNNFDSISSLMRPRLSNGEWLKYFIIDRQTPDVYEANATQYSGYIMHDVYSWIDLLGGDNKTEKWLNDFFDATKGNKRQHGYFELENSITLHIPYKYNYIGKPYKTQKIIHDIFSTNISDQTNGLPTIDNCGELSAWIVLNSIGIYPFCPGLPQYTIGTPMFKKVVIHLENKKTFEIKAKNACNRNYYIQSATLNENPFTKNYLDHVAIDTGGKIEFVMDINPNATWGNKKNDRPEYCNKKTNDAKIPFIKFSDDYFEKSAFVTIINSNKTTEIHYTTDGSEPNKESTLYTIPFEVKQTTTIKAKLFGVGKATSITITDTIRKFILNPSLKFILKKNEKMPLGLKCKLYQISTTRLPNFSTMTPIKEGIVDYFDFKFSPLKDYFAFEFEGLINVPKDGIYTFSISSDDGSLMNIDDKEILRIDNIHSGAEHYGKVGLKKGYHSFQIQYFENYGNEFLDVYWAVPGGIKQRIPKTVLFQSR